MSHPAIKKNFPSQQIYKGRESVLNLTPSDPNCLRKCGGSYCRTFQRGSILKFDTYKMSRHSIDRPSWRIHIEMFSFTPSFVNFFIHSKQSRSLQS